MHRKPFVSLKLDTRGLDNLAREAVDALQHSPPNSPILQRMLRRVAFIWRAFLQKRFRIFSRGGGDWPPLSARTLRARAFRPVERLQFALDEGHITQEQYDERIGRAMGKYRRESARIERGTVKYAILIDTGTMFRALAPTYVGAPGQLEEFIRGGIRFGFGGPSRHPRSKTESIADIAARHDTGDGVPQRQIMVGPDFDTKLKIKTEVQRGLNEIVRVTRIRSRAAP